MRFGLQTATLLLAACATGATAAPQKKKADASCLTRCNDKFPILDKMTCDSYRTGTGPDYVQCLQNECGDEQFDIFKASLPAPCKSEFGNTGGGSTNGAALGDGEQPPAHEVPPTSKTSSSSPLESGAVTTGTATATGLSTGSGTAIPSSTATAGAKDDDSSETVDLVKPTGTGNAMDGDSGAAGLAVSGVVAAGGILAALIL